MKFNLFAAFISLFSIISSSISTDFICDEKQCIKSYQPYYNGKQLLFVDNDLLFIVHYPINYEIKYISPLEYNDLTYSSYSS